jgi:hypothetical protein
MHMHTYTVPSRLDDYVDIAHHDRPDTLFGTLTRTCNPFTLIVRKITTSNVFNESLIEFEYILQRDYR